MLCLVVGASKCEGEIMFSFKYKDSEEEELVPAKEANVRFPQLVIEFYEGKIFWDNN